MIHIPKKTAEKIIYEYESYQKALNRERNMMTLEDHLSH